MNEEYYENYEGDLKMFEFIEKDDNEDDYESKEDWMKTIDFEDYEECTEIHLNDYVKECELCDKKSMSLNKHDYCESCLEDNDNDWCDECGVCITRNASHYRWTDERRSGVPMFCTKKCEKIKNSS